MVFLEFLVFLEFMETSEVAGPGHLDLTWQGHRGIGASAPCLAAVPVVCDTTRLQLGSTTTQAVAVPLYSHRHWYNVRRIVGGDRDLNAPCWLRRYAACFLFINSGVSHGLNGGALPNASTRRRFHPTHVC